MQILGVRQLVVVSVQKRELARPEQPRVLKERGFRLVIDGNICVWEAHLDRAVVVQVPR